MKPRRGILIAGVIAVVIAVVWVSPPFQEWYVWSCKPISQRPSTKDNMHDVQLAVEDFAIEHNGRYPSTTDELAPYVASLRLHNSFTKLRMPVIVRDGPLAAAGDSCEPGTVIVTRPDSASYEICGCNLRGRWMELRVRNELEDMDER